MNFAYLDDICMPAQPANSKSFRPVVTAKSEKDEARENPGALAASLEGPYGS